MQLAFLSDGLALAAVAACYLTILLIRVLRRSPGWVAPTLLGTVALAALLRATIAREAILTAWTYIRTVPLAQAISTGPVFEWLVGQGRSVYLTDLIFDTNLVLACLTPLPLFLHSNFLLKDVRVAVAAAFLLAILPVHIAFSRSDVYFIQSLFFSSLAFATLYSALTDPSLRWRQISLLFLGPLLWTVFLARPLNLAFFPLLLATIFVTVGSEVPNQRRWIAALVVTIPAVLDLLLNLFVGYGSQVGEGLGLKTITQAWRMLFDLERNTVLNTDITPLGIPILMALGLRTLWTGGKRTIAVYLLGWFIAFFVTHAYIFPFRATMMARYHLHLVVPTILMAAAALPRVLRLGTVWRATIALYLLASPVLHIGFAKNVENFSIQREFKFLTELRSEIPQGCVVVDYVGPAGCTRGPRLERIGAYAGRGQPSRWQSVLLIGAARGSDGGRPMPKQVVTTDGVDAAIDGHDCALFYEGNLCRSYGNSWSDLAPACKRMHEVFDLAPIRESRYTEHIYDPADARGLCGPATTRYDPPTDEATLRLYRIKRKSAPETQ